MTPSDVRHTIEDICDGLEQRRREMINASGTDRTQQPFKLTFDPEVVSYGDMKDILAAVRDRFPQWTIKAEWKTT